MNSIQALVHRLGLELPTTTAHRSRPAPHRPRPPRFAAALGVHRPGSMKATRWPTTRPRRRGLLLQGLAAIAAAVLPTVVVAQLHNLQRGDQGQAPTTLKMNPKYMPLGYAGAAMPAGEKPTAFHAKLEQGKELRYGGAGGVGRDEMKALELFKEVANASSASSSERVMAQYELALLYTTGGTNVRQDLPMAVKTFSGALEFAEAKHALAFYLATGFGNKPADEISAFKLEGAAAEGGSIPAALAVAFRLLHGVDDVMPDCQKALEIYRNAAKVVVEQYEAVADINLKRHDDEIAWLEARRAKWGEETNEAARKRLLAAASGKGASKEALYEVAKMYDSGDYGMVANPARALEFYQAAAAMGHPGGMADLGILYALASETKDGPHTVTQAGDVAQDLDVAVDLLKRAAELGETQALTALAHMYLEGTGVDRDEDKAHDLFEQAASKDNAEALFYYGERLAGEGDLFGAAAAYHRSGELGNAYGAYREGMLLTDERLDPELFPRSCPAAAEAFKRAAECGLWSAGPRFGMELYKRGEYTAAVAVLAMGAEEGYELAQANAAYMLAHRMGYGYDDADELALRLYERAAMQSDVHLYALGDLMLRMEAKGVDTTSGMTGPVLGVAQALSYIEAAAEQGHVPALRRLAEMYEEGEEGVVAKDTGQALQYYRDLLAAFSAESVVENKDWAAVVDRETVQGKITELSVKTGVGKCMGVAEEEEVVRGMDDIAVQRKAKKWMGAR